MNKGGFSWKRLTGITKAKQKVSRKTGVPLTKSGRQRKIGKIVTGGKGCLVTILLVLLLLTASSVALFAETLPDTDCPVIDTSQLSSRHFAYISLLDFKEEQRGCCSHHGGVCSCENGRKVCCDGTYSPSCTCHH